MATYNHEDSTISTCSTLTNVKYIHFVILLHTSLAIYVLSLAALSTDCNIQIDAYIHSCMYVHLYM